MIGRLTHWSRWTLALGAICSLVSATNAQPTLWGTAASTGSFPNGRLIKIDYLTGAVQATFGGPNGFIIGDGFSGVGVRPSNGEVFVSDGFGTNRLLRFDPVTGAFLGSFPSPTGSTSLDGLEFFGNELYAHAVAQSAIYRINPDTGALIGSLPNSFPSSTAGGLTLISGVLFAHGALNNTTISRRDLTTGAILSEFATPNNEQVLGLATDGASLFASSNAGFIYRLDPSNGAVLDSRNIGINLDGLGALITVPEPSSAWLVLTPVLVGCVRRRRQRPQPIARTQG